MKQTTLPEDKPLPFNISIDEAAMLIGLLDNDGYGTAIEGTDRWERLQILQDREWVTLKWIAGVKAWMITVTQAGRDAVADAFQEGYVL